MIKALVLDFGNVISEPHDDSVYTRMADRVGLTTEFFSKAFWKYRNEFDGGKIRGKEMYRRVLVDGGVSGTESELDKLAEELIAEDIESWMYVNPGVTEWALSLQKEGYLLGILSNMPHDFLEIAGHTVELFSRADVPVFSCHVGEIKPDPAIYRILIERLGCEASEIVFYDDLEPNIRAARELGIRAHLWTGLEKAKADWTRTIGESSGH